MMVLRMKLKNYSNQLNKKRNCEGVKGYKLVGVKHFKKELKKLESSVNYDRKEGEFECGS